MAAPFQTDHHVVPGEVEQPEPGIRIVTAPNAGPMTFTGTRSYIVGRGEVAVIDPGPDDPAHLRAILAALEPGERVRHILVTHSHADHAPLARGLSRLTGAPVLAFGPHGAGMRPALAALARRGGLGGGEGADRDFAPDIRLAHGQTVEGRGWALTALHTPGHLSNHLCFVLEDSGAVFTGDHVMGWATTLISPPDGDLTAFMDSLRLMQGRADRIYYPGHGAPVQDPAGLVAHILRHRAAREAQIRAALAEAPDTPAGLVARIYADVDPALHRAAARNVLAHLLDLVERGLAEAEGEPGPEARFRPTPAAV